MTIKGKANKLKCGVCGCSGFYVYQSETELLLMVRCMDCENSQPIISKEVRIETK